MVKVGFFPLDIDYVSGDSGKAIIRLFGRTIDGKRIIVLDDTFNPYFWAILGNNVKDQDILENIKKCKKGKVLDVVLDKQKYFGNEVDCIKVICHNPEDVPKLRKEVEGLGGIKFCREADISFSKRYLVDKGISPLVLCNVEGEPIVKKEFDVDFLIKADKIESDTEYYKNPRILSFDIETYTSFERFPDERRDPIISVAFYGDGFKKVISWKKINTEMDVTFVDGEADLISEFKKTIKEYKPDYLAGYFSDGFDFPYLNERAKKYNILLNLGLDNSVVKISRRGNGKAKIKGLIHIDLLKFIKRVMGGSLKLDNYSLGTVSKALLNEEKLEMDFENMGLIWDSNSQEIEKILEYNIQDARLTYKLFKVVLDNLDELVKLVSHTPYEVSRMSYGQLVEGYLVKRAFEFNELCPNKPDYGEIVERRTRTYQGAFVIEPKAGFYENLVVFDFKGLYPSIIISKNIDPGALTDDKKDSYKTPEIIHESGVNVNYYFSYKKENFIPSVVKDLVLRRNRINEIIKKEGKKPVLEARSYGLKTISNSLYGYYGYFGARWYSPECASSITAFGRQYIKDVVKKAEKEFDVIYGDTDSIFLCLKNKSKEDALNFLNEINGGLPSLMELELDGFYPKGIFVMKKSGGTGAKKKYALIDENDKIKIRGFETVRRDWSYLAKEVQLKVLEIVLKKGSVEQAFKYVKDVINNIREKKYDLEKMIIRTQLKRDTESYDQIGPHVVIARKLKEKGVKVGPGSMMKYIVTEGKGLIRDKVKTLEECKADEYDAEYYVHNQIIPAVKMIFEAMGYSEEDLVSSADQSKLGDF